MSVYKNNETIDLTTYKPAAKKVKQKITKRTKKGHREVLDVVMWVVAEERKR